MSASDTAAVSVKRRPRPRRPMGESPLSGRRAAKRITKRSSVDIISVEPSDALVLVLLLRLTEFIPKTRFHKISQPTRIVGEPVETDPVYLKLRTDISSRSRTADKP